MKCADASCYKELGQVSLELWVGFSGLGFMGLGFRFQGFRGLGFRGFGFWVASLHATHSNSPALTLWDFPHTRPDTLLDI